MKLNQTNITSLPEYIGEFKELAKLGLRRTKITGLPNSIGECKNLR